MAIYAIHAAKTNPSKRVALAEAGEEVVLARGKDAVVKIVPVESKAKPKRKFGAFMGKIKIGPEFFDPLPEEELKLWE